MKYLVVYYSQTGTTERVAQYIAQEASAQCIRIADRKNRKGILGYFLNGMDGTLKRTTVIDHPPINLSTFDVIFFGTPLWVSVTPAMRTFMVKHAGSVKNCVFFCTMGGSGGRQAFEDMENILHKKPLGTLEIRSDEVKDGTYRDSVREFIRSIGIQKVPPKA